MKKALYGLFSIPSLKNKYLSLTILAVLSLFCVNAQKYTEIHNGQAIDYIAAIKYLGVPYGPAPDLNSTRTVPGAIFFNTTDSSFYGWTGTGWIRSSADVNSIELSGKFIDSLPLNWNKTFFLHYFRGVKGADSSEIPHSNFFPSGRITVANNTPDSGDVTIGWDSTGFSGGSAITHAYDSSSISGDGLRYIYYSAGDSVGTVLRNASINLSNTNLTQTGNRYYDAAGYPLNFYNFSNIGFANATGALYINPTNTILTNNTKITLTSALVSFPSTSQNDALTRIAVFDGSNNLYYRNLSSISTGVAWGAITGTLSAQTDLQTALNLKLNISDSAGMLLNYRNQIITNTAAILGKQATLVSGTNIKTINGTSLLGSGDLVISSGTTVTTSEQSLTATAAQTAFTFTGVPASYNDYFLVVNGGVWVSTTGFTTSGNVITTTTPLDAGDVVTLRRTK